MVTADSKNGVNKAHFYVPPVDQDQFREVQLRKHIEKKYGVDLKDYSGLHRWSCDNYDKFWPELIEFCDVRLGTKWDEVIDKSKSIAEFPEWFPGATLNYAENIIERGQDNDPAFITAKLSTKLCVHTYKELRRDVRHLATALRQNGLKPGDSVCGFMPNTYECAVAMFATTSIGAVWSSASCDFGYKGVLDRFSQVKPKMLFSVEAVTYKEKVLSQTEKLNEIVPALMPEKIILVNNLKRKPFNGDFGSYTCSERYIDYEEFVQSGRSMVDTFKYEQMPFMHPLFIMFSSGTTGIPKAIVHTVGGVLLKHVEEHMIQGDTKSTDRMLFYTTCGWMMWNWLMSFLYCGGAIVLYDECPFIPDRYILFKIAAKTETSMIGMGARLYDEFLDMGDEFCKIYDLSKLRTIFSTGSPLSTASFEFINSNIAPGAQISSISGGTDILGCFMGGAPTLSVHSGECSGPFLGMDIHAYNSEGKPVYDQRGELVCVTPFPSMPLNFLGDPEYKRYKKAYFERFDGIWAHGDFCIVTKQTGGITMLGRSDSTLNRGGVRIGTAEIYAVVDSLKVVDDSVVVGKWDQAENDEKIYLFLKLSSEADHASIELKLRKMIRDMMSPRHVPNFIFPIEDIPYTHSGKKAELAVKQVLQCEKVENTSSLRNPEALDCYKSFQN